MRFIRRSTEEADTALEDHWARVWCAHIAAQKAAKRAMWGALRKSQNWVAQLAEVSIWIAKIVVAVHLVALLCFGMLWIYAREQGFGAGQIGVDTLDIGRSLATLIVLVGLPFSRWRLPGSPVATVWRQTYERARTAAEESK